MIKKIDKGAATGFSEAKATEKPRRQRDKQQQINELRAAQNETHRKTAYFDGPTVYQYKRGPDGKTYVVDATTSVDTSPVPGDPKATIRKMESIQRNARDISEAVIQQAAKEAKKHEQAAKVELEASGLDEHETPVWGDKPASRLGEAFASQDPTEATNAGTRQGRHQDEQAPDIEQTERRVQRKRARSGRALSTYRGSGSVITPTPAHLHPFGIKAK
jgi:hypothetical protein